MKLKFEADFSLFKKWRAQVVRTRIDVGWLNDVEHWSTKNDTAKITVPALASHLHHWSQWHNSFMFEDDHKSKVQLNSIVGWAVGRYLGNESFFTFAKNIGEEISEQLRQNIIEVDSPPNDPKWASIKGFNDPLIFGSAYGYTPNLLSEVSFELKGIG